MFSDSVVSPSSGDKVLQQNELWNHEGALKRAHCQKKQKYIMCDESL